MFFSVSSPGWGPALCHQVTRVYREGILGPLWIDGWQWWHFSLLLLSSWWAACTPSWPQKTQVLDFIETYSPRMLPFVAWQTFIDLLDLGCQSCAEGCRVCPQVVENLMEGDMCGHIIVEICWGLYRILGSPRENRQIYEWVRNSLSWRILLEGVILLDLCSETSVWPPSLLK